MDFKANRGLEWSGKHTRLRYQAVLSAMIFVSVCLLTIETFTIPGFFKFKGKPPYFVIWLSSLFFYLFSLFAFKLQTELERKTVHISSSNIVEEFSEFVGPFSSKFLEKIPNFQAQEFYESLVEIEKEKGEDKDTFVYEGAAKLAHGKIYELVAWEMNAGRKLKLLKANFLSVKPELGIICGSEFLYLRRLEIIINDIVDDFTVITEKNVKINAGFDSFLKLGVQSDSKESINNLMTSAAVVDSRLKSLAGSFPLYENMGSKLLKSASSNLRLNNISSNLLSDRIPFYLALFLGVIGIALSGKNVFNYWSLQ